jgi:hypothetical protein
MRMIGGFYAALEKYRPLSHKNAVFMVDNDDDIDLAGGGTEFVFKVIPHGKVTKHDMNWSSEISSLIGDGHSLESKEVKLSATNYWAGIPHPNENVWEYLAASAEIIEVYEF